LQAIWYKKSIESLLGTRLQVKGFGVRQLAAALSSRELARRQTSFIQGPKHTASKLVPPSGKSGSKLPHSKALRAGSIFRAMAGRTGVIARPSDS